MLKTLRITSLAAVILAVCGVLVTAFFGFKEDPDKAALLESPSITEKFKGQETKADQKEGDIHPLVTQAKAFALRINPPPPPPPPPPKNSPKPTAKPQITRQPVRKPEPPRPPVVHTSFQVLATVRYETEPSRSLALLKSGNTYEWFRQGEKAGHLDIDEILDGSVVVSQGGRNPQTLHVPARQQSKSLLKGESAVASGSPSAGSTAQAAASTASFVSDSGVVSGRPSPVTRSRTMTSRVGRVRTLPPPPTPAQKKEELKKTVTGIQEIMNRQDDSMTEEQRQAENQMWMELLNALKKENEGLAQAEAPSGRPADTSEEGGTPAAEESPAEQAVGEESEFSDEGEEMPAADEAAEFPDESAETEDQADGEFEESDSLTSETEEPVGEEGFTDEGEGEGFEPVEETAEGESPDGFDPPAEPNEY